MEVQLLLKLLSRAIKSNSNEESWVINYKLSSERKMIYESNFLEYVSVTLILSQVYNPLDAKCDVPRPDAICPNQLKSVEKVSSELLKGQPDHRIILPYRFFSYNYSIPHLFKPGSYSRFIGKLFGHTFRILHMSHELISVTRLWGII